MRLLDRLLHGSPFGKSFCFCAPSPPPAPDYAGAAQAQGEANVEAVRTQSRLNNPNIINPYGTQTVTYGGGFNQAAYNQAQADWADAQARHQARYGVPIPTTAYKPGYEPPKRSDFISGDPDQVTIRQTLSPDQQQLLDTSNQAKIGMSNLALQGTQLAQDVLGQRLDFGALPQAPGSAEATRAKVYDAMMGRVNEDADRKKELLNSNLVAAGIPHGSKAYNDAMALEERNRTDASTQAFLASGQEASRDFGMDSQRRQQALAELMTERQTPINEITALMSGSQVNNPFTVNAYAQNNQVQAAPIFGATQAAGDWNADLYNVRAAQAGNLQSGLFAIGGAGLQAAAKLSDRRLKRNIVKIGNHPLGIGWYEYDIGSKREQGVMAQELLTVKPEAVSIGEDGFYRVDYGQIGRP